MIVARMPAYRLCTGHALAVACFRRIAALTTAIRTAMPVITNLGVNLPLVISFAGGRSMSLMDMRVRLQMNQHVSQADEFVQQPIFDQMADAMPLIY